MYIIGNRYKIIEFDYIINDKIYKAEDTYKNKKVLIKLIKHNKHIKEDFLNDLIDEITQIREIDSPYISPIRDVGLQTIDGEVYYYIVNKFFDGITLEDYINHIRNNDLKVGEIVSIISKIVKGLEFIHSTNIYHGNISPRNILIDDSFDIRVLDFLITKANKGENIRNVDLKYLAPQQISINYTDFESDFYSVGLILFELMFDKFPYECSDNDIEMLKNMDKRIIWKDYEYLVENKELFEVCKKLLSRVDKYRNIKDIIFDVTSIMYKKAKIKENKEVKKEVVNIENKKEDNKDISKVKVKEKKKTELKSKTKDSSNKKIFIMVITLFMIISIIATTMFFV